MPRSIWNGTLAIGLVHVPVKVHSATEDKGIHFHEVHSKDGARIRHKRICSKEDQEVPYEEVVKGYEVSRGEYVVLTKEEIAAAAGERSRVIDVDEFVCGADIDPVFYEKTYWLGARDGGEDSYRLLGDALEASGRVGLGRWVFHNREYLVTVRPRDGILAMETMRFHDEVVDPGDLDLPEVSKKPSEREVEMAGTLVDKLLDPFKPEKLRDEYRERVLDLVERKRRGEEIEVPEPADEEDGRDDLAAALEASLEGARKR